MTSALRCALLVVAFGVSHACSAYAAGKLATQSGSVMVSHSDDGDGVSDPRVSYIPAADHPKGAQRLIWPDLEDYPRFVGTARGATYTPLPGQNTTQPIGFITQVAHTYAYYEANYAIQNECGLMFGESTASAAFKAFALGQPNGTALFSINELTRIASERVCNAREAVQLIGDLAVAQGFYGADGGAGETLMVGDAHEAYVFHILSDPTGKSAVWAAQRVPDTHVAVIANMFTLRELNMSEPNNYLASDNVHQVALDHGLWNGTGLLDFTKTYSKGEYSHKYYSGRRMWDGLRHFKPSLKLPAEYGDLKNDKPLRPWGRSTYPWAVVPDTKLTPQSWFAAHRSHYEGTPYSTTEGDAAGPFGTPDRYATQDAPGDPGVGSWERTVSIYRTTYTWVVCADASKASALAGTIWWGAGDSSKTVFTPMMVAAGEPPEAVTHGRQAHIDRRAMYWAVRYVANLAQIRYDRMIVDIQAAASSWEAAAQKVLDGLQPARGEAPPSAAALKAALDAHAARVLAATWQLADDLMVRYADGHLTTPKPDGTVTAVELGYPRPWLSKVNFTAGPARLGPPA